jgi:hypothetical protein
MFKQSLKQNEVPRRSWVKLAISQLVVVLFTIMAAAAGPAFKNVVGRVRKNNDWQPYERWYGARGEQVSTGRINSLDALNCLAFFNH